MQDGPPVAKDLSEANAIIAALWEQNGLLREQVRRLESRVADLEARLAQDSSSSSKPPSSDPPWRKKRKRKPPKKPSGRKAGGQPGHEGKARQAAPPERVDAVIDVLPDRCQGCGDAFVAGCAPDDFVPHQVFELPKMPAFVTEYRMAGVCCDSCGTKTRAQLPVHVPAGSFGGARAGGLVRACQQAGIRRGERLPSRKATCVGADRRPRARMEGRNLPVSVSRRTLRSNTGPQ